MLSKNVSSQLPPPYIRLFYLFFAMVSVVGLKLLNHNLLSTDTWCRWGVDAITFWLAGSFIDS